MPMPFCWACPIICIGRVSQEHHYLSVFARLYTCTYHIDLYVWLKKRALYMLVLVGCWPVNSGYQPYRQRAVRAVVAVSPTHPRSAHT